jgi:hypothetical protein
LSRWDKLEPHVGQFRAPLAAAYTGVVANLEFGKLIAVSLNASGQVVIGTAGASGFKGCIILNEAVAAGRQVDVVQLGEVVEFTLSNGAAAATGTNYTTATAADGTYGTTAPGASNFKIGFTIEATRLILRCAVQ